MVEAIENGKVSGPSDLINVNVLFVARAVAVLVKLKVAVVATLVAISACETYISLCIQIRGASQRLGVKKDIEKAGKNGNVRVRLVDLGVLGQFAVRLETSGLVGRVLQDDVAFLVLVVPQREQDDVTLVDPHLLAQLAPDMREALLAVETLRLKSTISKHLDYLSVLWGHASAGRLSGREVRNQREEGRFRVALNIPWPSSLKVSSRFSLSFSFFPRRRFLPP